MKSPDAGSNAPLPLSRLRRKAPAPLALEPRLMFDAHSAKTVPEHVVDAAHLLGDAGLPVAPERPVEHPVEKPAMPAATGSNDTAPNEIVFVDTSVADWQTLAGNVRPGAKVVLIDPTSDGLAQIEAALQGGVKVDAIHILSHGEEGTLLLGSGHYTAGNLGEHAAALAAIGGALNPGGDILLYGCEIARGADGAALVGRISAATGRDVAASTDATGDAAAGANWNLEYQTGRIDAGGALTDRGKAEYHDWLSSLPLDGKSGWTAIMYGVNQDPHGDSQAGAADTDIIGDGSHGSLYTAYDSNGTGSAADDTLMFRLRIDNPTSSTTFNGVAIVGLDANLDGRIDLFISVDGRNNTQAVRLLDPGTGANISPSTTTTSPLPTGWLVNNGVYAFTAQNYSVAAASAGNDPHWNGSADLSGDGKTDVFVSWRIPIADIAAVLAKPSPVDRNGIYGPRGASGVGGFTKDTVVQYVAFTQTQPGPINGDINGVGANYDKNATFASLGALTAPMSASNPVPAGPELAIAEPIGSGTLNAAQDGAVTISGTSKYLATKPITVTVTDGVHTVTGTGTTAADGTWSISGFDLSGMNDGTLNVTAKIDPDGDAGTTNDVLDTASVLHDRTPPTIAIDAFSAAVSGRPTITGQTDMPDGSLITIRIDTDNNPLTTDLVYQVIAAGGVWSLNTSSVAPVSGTMPASGLTSYSKITATAADAAGNTATAVALNPPTVTTLSTNRTAPVISGTWTNVTGDVLTVTVSGATYTLSPSGNTWSLDLATATPTSGSLTPLVGSQSYEVTAKVARGGTFVTDSSTLELAITTSPVITIGINGGASASGSNTSPTLSGTSANAGGYVIVRLDPENDGDLSDAVTYSVATDGSGNWTLDTSSATPIAGTKPSAGFIGATGVYATDSTGAVSADQVLTISTPTIAISGITSTATGNSMAGVDNGVSGKAWLNTTEDKAVQITGTATNGVTVDVVVADTNGNSVRATGLTVTGGTWTASGLNLASLDNTQLTVTATLSGTELSATDTSVTHDKTAPLIFNTTQSVIQKTSGAIIQGSTDLPQNTSLKVELYSDAAYTALVTSGTATVASDGTWSMTTAASLGNGSTIYIRVYPATTATDAAGNIAQKVDASRTVSQSIGNTDATISISTITGVDIAANDNAVTAGDISGGSFVVSGVTNKTSSSVSVTISDGTTSRTLTTTSSTATSAAWSVAFTSADIKALKNGPITITSTVTDASKGVNVSQVKVPVLDLSTPVLTISDDVAGTASGAVLFTFQFSENVTGFDATDVTVTGGTKGVFSGSGSTYTLAVTPNANSSGNIVVSVGTGAATGVTTGRGNAAASDTQAYNTTAAAAAPTLSVDSSGLAANPLPVITGTTSLSAGAPVVIAVDADNDGVAEATYSATVKSGGTWSLDLAAATPTSGSIPGAGLAPSARITVTATNAYGISTTATGLNKPTVDASTTNQSRPTVTGTWTQVAGDTLSVVVNGTSYSVSNGNLSVTAAGWSLSPAAPLADGTYEVAATVSRASGGAAADPTSNELLIDTAASVTISGGATADITGNAFPVIGGTSAGLPAGTVLTLSLDTNNDGTPDLVYKTTVSAGGAWSVDTATAVPVSGTAPADGLNGPVPLLATATDPAGNVGSDTQVLTVDVTPPEIALTFNGKTSDPTPLITGTTDLPAGSLITIEIDPNNDGNWSDKQTYTATVQSDGTWSVEASTPISGLVGVRASGSDSVGNSTTTPTKLLEYTTVAPVIRLTKPIPAVGVDNVADATEDDAIVFSGTTDHLATGSTVAVTITDGTLTISDSAEVASDGSWSLAAFNLSSMANGTITVTATVVDSDGSAYTDHTSFVHAKAAVVSIDSISQDTGALGDFVTKDNTVAVVGSSGAGASVSVVLKDAGGVTVATLSATAGSDGVWSTVPSAALAAGNYTIEATVSGTTASHSLTIVDATAPTLSSSIPSDDAGSLAVSANIVLTFSKPVQAGSGYISLYRADGTLIENFNVATGVGDQGGTLQFDGALQRHAGSAGEPGEQHRVLSEGGRQRRDGQRRQCLFRYQ